MSDLCLNSDYFIGSLVCIVGHTKAVGGVMDFASLIWRKTERMRANATDEKKLDSTTELVMLAKAVVRGDNVDPGQLCRAAIAVADNPPEDRELARFADLLIDASFGWVRFNGSRLRLATAVRAYAIAASLVAADN